VSDHGLLMRTEKISRISKIWDEIFNSTPDPSPFLSYEWFCALCHKLLKTDPDIMVFWEDNKPVGIFPSMVESKTLRLIGDERVSDLNGVLYLPSHKPQFMEALASLITSNEWGIDLFPLDANSPVIQLLPTLVDGISVEETDLNPTLSLPDTWDEYLDILNGKQRHELRRKLRKANGIEIRTVDSDQIKILFQLMVASSNDKKEFLVSEVREFFKSIADSFSENKWLRFRVVFHDSQPIGVVFSFQFKDCIYLFNSGFDPEYYSLSPGIVAIALDIKSAIDEGVKYYDFLRGGEKYKFDFGAEERYTKRLRR